MPKQKLLIAVPGFHGIQPEVQTPFMAMMYHCGRVLSQAYDIAPAILTKREQFRARNNLVDQAIGGGFDWLLMLDDDMIVPYDLLPRLLTHDKDICGALYYQRGGGYHPVIMVKAKQSNGDWVARFIRYDHPMLKEPGLHKVDVIGGGCMLFKVDVFRKLLPPYFWWEYTTGTDIAICTRLADAGFAIYCDTSLELGHLRSDRDVITSRTVPLSLQATGEVNECLWQDAAEYLRMPEVELESAMNQASIPEQHRDKWGTRATDPERHNYYREHGNWHLFNLLYFNMLARVPAKEWMLLQASGVLGAGGRVIDYGCGLGHLTIPLADRGQHVIAVELADTPTGAFVRWRLAKHHLEHHVQLYELAEGGAPLLPLEIPADGACCISVLEHLTDPWGVIQWLTAHIKSGGFLVVDYACHKKDDEPQHLVRYDPQTFEADMRSYGWTVSPEYPWLFLKR